MLTIKVGAKTEINKVAFDIAYMGCGTKLFNCKVAEGRIL